MLITYSFQEIRCIEGSNVFGKHHETEMDSAGQKTYVNMELKMYQFHLVHLGELPLASRGEVVEGKPHEDSGKQGRHVGHGEVSVYQGPAHNRHHGHHWNTGSPTTEKV